MIKASSANRTNSANPTNGAVSRAAAHALEAPEVNKAANAESIYEAREPSVNAGGFLFGGETTASSFQLEHEWFAAELSVKLPAAHMVCRTLQTRQIEHN